MSITLYVGPMFASKSTHLLGHIREFESMGTKYISICHYSDNRYGTSAIRTHDGDSSNSIERHTLSDLNIPDDVKAIIIDEGQFFQDIVEFCDTQANNGKVVIVAALDGDYMRKPFGKIHELIPRTENVHKLFAKCVDCECRASFTKLIKTDVNFVEECGIRRHVASNDSYVPVCRIHYKSSS